MKKFFFFCSLRSLTFLPNRDYSPKQTNRKSTTSSHFSFSLTPRNNIVNFGGWPSLKLHILEITSGIAFITTPYPYPLERQQWMIPTLPLSWGIGTDSMHPIFSTSSLHLRGAPLVKETSFHPIKKLTGLLQWTIAEKYGALVEVLALIIALLLIDFLFALWNFLSLPYRYLSLRQWTDFCGVPLHQVDTTSNIMQFRYWCIINVNGE